jgi:hypothetical protein
MQPHKIDNFKANQPGQSFPRFDSLDATNADRLKEEWASRLNLDPKTDALHLLNQIRKSSRLLEDDATTDGFNLARTLEREGIQKDIEVFLNWDRFRNVDRMRLSDLSSNWAYIWYPSSDDLEVFDDSWMLSIHHSGQISLWNRSRL